MLQGLHMGVKCWACAFAMVLLGLSAAAQAPGAKKQVVVSVKIIEFQTSKGVETGLSAYFTKVARAQPFGQVSTSGSFLNTLDLTFPTSSAAGLTVFLDRISFSEGEMEVVLQALVDENRAFILSKPHAIVIEGEKKPTVVETTQQIPYESTVVVGSTAVQVTKFEDTGVRLAISVPEIIDDDGDPNTRDDTYVQLDVEAIVKEEGQRIVVALDDQLVGADLAQNLITVPEFISRRIKTQVWVRDGQVLMLGGLYRNSETRNISSLPWLTQAENAAVGLVENVLAGSFAAPITGTLGSRNVEEGRRELVFLIKSEVWRPAFAISDTLGIEERSPKNVRTPPADVITEIGEPGAESPAEATQPKNDPSGDGP